MANQSPIRAIYCVKCAKITDHTGYVDHNNEFVFECPVLDKNKNSHCFVKFPIVSDAEELTALIEDYNEVQGEIGAQMAETRAQQSILSEVLSDGTKVTPPASTTPSAPQS
jgi:hypothetical protein